MSLSRLSRLGCHNLWRNTIFSYPASSSPLMISLKQVRSGFKIQIPHRQVSSEKKSFVGNKTLDDFHRKDGIPKSFTLIYRTNFPNYFLSAQVFVFLSMGAFIVAGLASFYESQTMNEEERQDAVKKKQLAARVAQETEKAGFQKNVDSVLGLSPTLTRFEEQETTKPSIADMVEKDLGIFTAVMVVLLALSFSLHKLVRMIPVRIYVGKKDHCVGVYYGSLLPGKLTNHDFVAGTLVKHRSKFAPEVWEECVFKDGSGNSIVIFEHFFRRVGDFNYLVGYVKSEDYNVHEDHLQQYKQLGSLSSEQKRKNSQ